MEHHQQLGVVEWAVIDGLGENLPISAMPADGTFPTGTAMFEKRKDNAQAEPEFGSSRGSSAGWSPSETFNTRNAAVIGATIRIKGEVAI